MPRSKQTRRDARFPGRAGVERLRQVKIDKRVQARIIAMITKNGSQNPAVRLDVNGGIKKCRTRPDSH
jgi:hypothetical protein